MLWGCMIQHEGVEFNSFELHRKVLDPEVVSQLLADYK